MRKNKCKRLLVSFLAICLTVAAISPQCYAFETDTHGYVTDVSLGILKDVYPKESDEFFTQDVNSKLIYFSKRPDIDENDGIFKWHYYNPITEKNFVKGKVTALTKFNDHYKNALTNYKKGNVDKSLEELGRSLHFIEDINTPVHTNSQDIIDVASYLNLHVKFETFVLSIQDNTKATMTPNEFVYYKNNTTTQIAKKHANISANNFYALYNKLVPQEEIASNSLSNAQKCVAGVLYKFYNQVTK